MKRTKQDDMLENNRPLLDTMVRESAAKMVPLPS